MFNRTKRVVVIGLDGLEPSIVEAMLAAGRLPHLAALRRQGVYGRVATTWPAQTPVAWSTFATGTNPGGHGIFDFLRRDPQTYLPNLALSRYEQRNPFVSPKVVNLRGGTAVWTVLERASIPATVLRCPCTYPPDHLNGRLLCGMGVPDVRGGLGTGTFYTQATGGQPLEDERLVILGRLENGRLVTHLIGPRNPRSRQDITFPLELRLSEDGSSLTIHSAGTPAQVPVGLGRWSGWLRVCFRAGLLLTVQGCVRFFLRRLSPALELYASPVNFDADKPLFPISSPPPYARQLREAIGTYYTTGMVEDHAALNNGRIDESSFLDQCGLVMRERESMLHHELDRTPEGLLFCLFDTPDRVQHMFWRFREGSHPANHGSGGDEYETAIEAHYCDCDAVVGRAVHRLDDQTLLLVLSDHGMGSFRRGLHLNRWLAEQGLLTFKAGQDGRDGQDMLRFVDWGRTKAYALGLGSLYLNRRGREAEGIVGDDEADDVSRAIVKGLTALRDPQTGGAVVRRVVRRQDVFAGPFLPDAPDLILGFHAGYRVSWATALGGAPEGLLEDNIRRWSGDHIVDPELTPGVLLANRPLKADGATLEDMAPTILAALGSPASPAMRGRSLLS